jgi:ubiquinone/menaquinone biosynthesis C-methylase UbiE
MVSSEYGFKQFSDHEFYGRQNALLVDLAGVGSGQRIVDLACGTGGVTKIIADRLKDAKDSVVIGIDHSSSALKQAMEELKGRRNTAVQFVQSQMENISEAVKERADTIILCNAIHYIPDKDALLAEIRRTLKPGGKLAFNTTFYDGSLPEETLIFYRKWMLKANRVLRREYGMSPTKAEKVEARKQLTPAEYSALLERHGFEIVQQKIDTVEFTKEGFLDISTFSDFIEGSLPGVPFETASAALQAGVNEAFEEMKVDWIPRNWLDIVAVRK